MTRTIAQTSIRRRLFLLISGLAAASTACRPEPAKSASMTMAHLAADQRVVVRDTLIADAMEVSGIAAPIRQSTLGTRLMASVTEVLVREGQEVAAGQVLARIDARDLAAQGNQARAGLAETEAVLRDAEVQAVRFRALYADSAAPKVQLDAAETGLLRARASMENARAATAGIDAVTSYAELRAPYRGTITRRAIDPGALVGPGTPMLTIEDVSELRIQVSVSPIDARGLTRGARLEARIEGEPVEARVEGVVPMPGGTLYTINALVDNRGGRLMAGGAATLLLPRPPRHGLLVPVGALVREGDLIGIRIWPLDGPAELRWVSTGWTGAGQVEILAGLRSGESIAVPISGEGSR